MKKLILITLLLLSITPCLRAQRKEMSQARSYIKSGKELDKAEKMLRELLAKDSANRQNPKIYLLLYDALRKQYEQGNEKLYLKQKYDTVAFFDLTKRIFSVLEALDSVDAAPDRKGRINMVYRRQHSAVLDALRPNIYYGGTFHMRKHDYAKAYSFFSTYIDCKEQPIFSGYDYMAKDRRMPEAAYWATYCGYKMSDAGKTLAYSDMVRHDGRKQKFVLRYIAEAYKQLNDTADYIKTLHAGFEKYPEYPYFFPRLTDHYTQAGRLDSALAVSDRALESDGRNALFLLAKSNTLLNMGRYDDCIVFSDSLIHVCDTIAEPYYNAGISYLNKALELEKVHKAKKDKATARSLYKKAQGYLEDYRKRAPEEKGKWAQALYRIYFNLNLGKQFEEMDKILKNLK